MILLNENFFSSGADAEVEKLNEVIECVMWGGVSKQVMIYTNIIVLYVIQFKSL